MSSANRVGIRYIEEVTWDTLPGTPTMTELRITADNLKHTKEYTQSQELRSDRNIADTVQTTASNQGGVDFELSGSSFDDFLEGAMFNSWSTDVLKNGVERHSYSIEKAFLDEGEYSLYRGMMVNTFSLRVATGSIVTGRFDFMGRTPVHSQATSAATITAATTTRVMNAMSNVGTIQEGSTLTALTGVYLQEISFTVNNNLRAINEVGSDVPAVIPDGSCEITGTLNSYFNSDRLLAKYLAGTESGLTFTITDAAGNSYVFLFPRIKFENDETDTPGLNQDVWENITWRALYDETEACQLKITRTIV